MSYLEDADHEIKQLQAALDKERELYQQLHIDYVNRGVILRQIKKLIEEE